MPEDLRPAPIAAGTAAYRRAVIALLAAGLATFNALYCTQAILPRLAEAFQLPAATAALTVSATTGMLALCIVPASILSERFGRGRVMLISVLATTCLGFFLPVVHSAGLLILLRAAQGVLLAGVPAVAMVWLAEELDPHALPQAMGIYISGSSIGGLLGRLIPTLALEWLSWQQALLVDCAWALLCAVLITLLLPRQRRFVPKPITPRRELAAMLSHWRHQELAGLFVLGFLLMGTFVSLFNYLGFRLIDKFSLPEALVGFIFLIYLTGTYSSVKAGQLLPRWGSGKLLIVTTLFTLTGLALMATPWLPVTILGMFLFTPAFFAAHSTASAAIGVIAKTNRAEASSMYLFCYYVGSSVLGTVTGHFLTWGWTALIIWLFTLNLGTLLLCWRLNQALPQPAA